MKFFLALLWLWLSPYVWGQLECFRRFPNMGVRCASPIERRSGITEQACLDLCTSLRPSCQAAEFELRSGRCDVFAVPLEPTLAGTGSGLRLRHQRQNRRFRRGSGYRRGYGRGGYKSGGGRGSGRYGAETGRVGGGGRNGQGYIAHRGHFGLPTQSRGYRSTSTRTGGCYGASATQKLGSNYFRPTGACDGGGGSGGTPQPPPLLTTLLPPTLPPPTQGPLPLPDEVRCPPGTTARFLLTEGVMLVETDEQEATSFQAQDEQECLTACADNRLPDGTAAPCLSINYNPTDGSCRLTTEAFPPLGAGEPANPADLGDPEMSYYEKVCVNSQDSQSCQGPFLRAPQRVLVGHVSQIFTADSINECLDFCLRSEGMDGETCNSVMFFFEEEELNCILNTETKDTVDEDLFAPEEVDAVDYYQLDCDAQRPFTLRVGRRRSLKMRRNGRRGRGGRVGKLQQSPSASLLPSRDSWGVWSACQNQWRVRFRACSPGAVSTHGCKREKKSCSKSSSGVAEKRQKGRRGVRRDREARIAFNVLQPGAKCNPFVRCCATRKTDGSKDCRIGFRYHSSDGDAKPKRISCQPTDC